MHPAVDPIAVLVQLGTSAVGIALLFLLVLSFSSYVKIITVLSAVRAGLGFGSLPAAFVTGSLALGLSFFVMYPTLERAAGAADKVLSSRGTSGVSDVERAIALEAAAGEWRGFVLQHTDKAVAEKFVEIARKIDAKTASSASATVPAQQGNSVPTVSAADSDSWRVLAPAFLVTELREAFSTALHLLLPFLLIDFLIVCVLTGLGIDKLDPSIVALPCKIALFVAVDGWALITANLVGTYGG